MILTVDGGISGSAATGFSWWLWLIGGLLIGVIGVVAVLIWRRWRLLSTPGSFPARLMRRDSDGTGPGSPVVVSYNETSVEVLMVVSLSPLPRFSIPRHRLTMERHGVAEAQSRSVLTRLTDDDRPKLQVPLKMAQAHCSELNTWIESGPMIGIGHWRDAPQRKQRRRFF